MPTPLHDQAKNVETEYFLRKEKELIERLRQKAEEEAKKKEMADATGVADEGILKELMELGFDRETLTLVHMIPLLEVAWADGQVSERERELVLDAARTRGVTAGSPGHEKLMGWLAERPPQVLFDRTLVLARATLAVLPDDRRDRVRKDLFAHCEAIAEASGGFLGFAKVSPEEKAALEKVARELVEVHAEAARKVLES
ncbi:hypothetical protein FBQ97_04820 [Acidobacteria bacterium ACD]|nr:MAG: hypothetical protein EDX89_06735 [Acidobacteriota bacterium]MCE7959119.1 hypothetical protein [Acidobacteria bacterium ACB2]MDL1949122.1 hypothetical protein [Acidobacteria bacterium ACD]